MQVGRIASRVPVGSEEFNVSIDPPPYNPAGAPDPASMAPPYMPTPGWQPGYGAQPGHGWAPPTTFPPGGYPMPPAPKRAPKRYWYAFAAVLTAVGLAVCGVGIGMVVNSIGKQPASDHTFGAAESTTVHIDAGETKVVYVANATAAGGHRVHCDTTGGDSGSIEMTQYQGSLTLNQWDATFTVTPSQTGDYTIRCTGVPTDTFGVGEDPGLGGIFASVVAIIAGAFIVIVGLSVLTVVAVLRRRRSA
jgi:hypothetical protein